MTEKIKQVGLKEVIDCRLLNSEFDHWKIERLVKVTLLCAQEDRETQGL